MKLSPLEALIIALLFIVIWMFASISLPKAAELTPAQRVEEGHSFFLPETEATPKIAHHIFRIVMLGLIALIVIGPTIGVTILERRRRARQTYD